MNTIRFVIKTTILIALSASLSLVALFYVGNYFTRGFFLESLPCFYNYDDDSVNQANFEFKIAPLANDQYEFLFRNRGWGTYSLLGYWGNYSPRDVTWEELPFFWKDYQHYDLTAEDIFLSTRSKVSYHDLNQIENSWFMCGTGLSWITIHPLESFRDTFSREEMLKHIGYIGNITIATDDNYLLYNGEKLLEQSVDRDNPKLHPDFELDTDEKLDLSLYVPVYSILSGKEKRIFSNSIQVSYREAIESAFAGKLKLPVD